VQCPLGVGAPRNVEVQWVMFLWLVSLFLSFIQCFYTGCWACKSTKDSQNAVTLGKNAKGQPELSVCGLGDGLLSSRHRGSVQIMDYGSIIRTCS